MRVPVPMTAASRVRRAVARMAAAALLCGTALPCAASRAPSPSALSLQLELTPTHGSPGRPTMHVTLTNQSGKPAWAYGILDLGVTLSLEVQNASLNKPNLMRPGAPISLPPIQPDAFTQLQPGGTISQTLDWPYAYRDISGEDGALRVRVTYADSFALNVSYPHGVARPKGVQAVSVASNWVTVHLARERPVVAPEASPPGPDLAAPPSPANVPASHQPTAKVSIWDADTALVRLLATPVKSINLWLRDASRAVPPKLLNQSLADIEWLAKYRHLDTVESRENGSALIRHFVLKRHAFRLRSGKYLDAYLIVLARNLVEGSVPAHPGPVFIAHVALGLTPNAAYSEAVRSYPMPRGPVFARVMSCPIVKRAGERWPVLKQLLVHYGPMDFISAEVVYSGFFFEATYVAAAGKQRGEATVDGHIESGLDPGLIYTEKGMRPVSSRFVPRDTLGRVESGGGSEAWYDEPEVTGASKRRYLRDR